MAAVHRQNDSRACGATTNVVGQSTVFVNNLLLSVNGDPNSHNGGALIANCNNVYAENKLVVDIGDNAAPDALCVPIGGAHCNPSATSGSPNVFVGD